MISRFIDRYFWQLLALALFAGVLTLAIVTHDLLK